MAWAGTVAVATHQYSDSRPTRPDGTDDMAQHNGNLRAVPRLAGAQDDGDRLACRGLVDLDRLKAAAVVERV